MVGRGGTGVQKGSRTRSDQAPLGPEPSLSWSSRRGHARPLLSDGPGGPQPLQELERRRGQQEPPEEHGSGELGGSGEAQGTGGAPGLPGLVCCGFCEDRGAGVVFGCGESEALVRFGPAGGLREAVPLWSCDLLRLHQISSYITADSSFNPTSELVNLSWSPAEKLQETVSVCFQ